MRVCLCFFSVFILSCGDRLSAESSADIPMWRGTDVLAVGPHPVTTSTETFIDTTRVTPANGDYEGAPDRKLVTEIWAPQGEGPWPLLLYAHGFMSSRLDNALLCEHLASHGFIVAGVDFPLSHLGAPGGATVLDVSSQPGDLSFVLDQLLVSDLGQQIMSDQIGVVGLSLGGLTGLLMTHDPERRDARVRALAAIAAPSCFLPDTFFEDRGIKLLLLHGMMDAIVPYAENAVAGYESAYSPKIRVGIAKGTHTGFADVAGELFSELPNADQVGCAAIEGNLPTLDMPVDSLGWAVDPSRCPAVCEGPLEPALSTLRQLELLRLVVTTFFASSLQTEPGATRLLIEGLSGEADELHVEAAF